MRLNDGRVVPAFIGQSLRGENLTIFGGGALASVCDAIKEHVQFKEHFASLLDENATFCEATIQEAFEFYIQVYSNLRLKDFCWKYNSCLSKTNTLGIRQSLVANRKSNNDNKKRKRSPPPEDDKLDEDELHLELEAVAEQRFDDDCDMLT